MKCAFALVLLTVGGATTAQQMCLEISDKDKRLDCYDKALNYKSLDVPAPQQPKAIPFATFTVRDRGDFTNFAGTDLGSKAGQFNLQHIDGKDSSTVRLGVISAFQAINDLGWQPFAAVGWNRDTAAKSPKDTRELSAGITGPLWDAVGPGWTIHPTVRATRRDDAIGSGSGTLLNLNLNLVKLSWVDSVQGPAANSFQFVPHLGWLGENRQGGGTDVGAWRSAYVGATLSAQLNRVLPRLSTAVTYRRFNDQSAPLANEKRKQNFGSLSFDYALTDPGDKSVSIRPSLTLSRETGADLLYGGAQTNKTVLGLSIKIN